MTPQSFNKTDKYPPFIENIHYIGAEPYQGYFHRQYLPAIHRVQYQWHAGYTGGPEPVFWEELSHSCSGTGRVSRSFVVLVHEAI